MISNRETKKKPFYEFILKIKGFYPVRIVEPQMNLTPKSSKKKQNTAGGGITENWVGDYRSPTLRAVETERQNAALRIIPDYG